MYPACNPVGSERDSHEANVETKRTAIRPEPAAQSKTAAKKIHGSTISGFTGKFESPHPENHVEINATEYEHSDSNPALSFTRELRPVLIVMAAVGLYHPPIDATKSLLVRLLNPRRLHCFVLNIVAWFNALRFMVPLVTKVGGNSDVLLKMIAPAMWNFQCAFALSCWFYQCTFAPRRFQAFVEHLHRFYSAVPRLMVGGERRWLKHTIFLSILIPTITNCLNGFILIFSTYGSIEELRNVSGYLLEPFEQEGRLPITFVYGICSMPFGYSIFVCGLFSNVLSRMFDKFNKNFKNCISNDGKLQYSFEKLRLEHQSLAKVVATGNAFFSTYIGFIVVTTLVQISFLLYLATRSSSQEAELIIFAYWFLVSSFWIGMLFWFAVRIHEQAHDAENYVHDILVWDQLEERTSIQVMLFLAKLHGTPIALTVWNLTPITKDFVLTVFGVLASYFIIIGQTFNP